MGWFDATQPLEERRNDRNSGKGARFSVAAFLSAEFGVLVDATTGDHVGSLDLRGTNTTKSTADLMEKAAQVLKRQYPNYFHVISMDSARIHAALPTDACNPSRLNVSDGGKNRVNDQLFGLRGLISIFRDFFPGENVAHLRKAELQDLLWEKDEVRAQLLLLEQVLGKHGVGMLFNPIAHPIFAAIELLWRDIKWDYKCNWEHRQAELETCLRAWLANATDPVDSELSASYFRKARAFVEFYLRGGTGKPSERDVTRWVADNFMSALPDGDAQKAQMMKILYSAVPGLPKALAEKKRTSPEQLRALLLPYFHKLNYMRIRRPLTRPNEDNADNSSEDDVDDCEEVGNIDLQSFSD
jgi:hypothetical protein